MKTHKMKMKIITFAAMITGFLSGSVALLHPENVKTEAVPLPAGQVLYLNPGTEWARDGARFAIDFFKGTGQQRVHMMQVLDVDNTYSATAPAGGPYSDFQILRLNPSNLSQVWNSSSYLVYDGTNDFYTITSAGNNPSYTKSVYVDPRVPVGTTLYVYPDASFKGSNFHHMAAYFFRDGTPTDFAWVSMNEDAKPGVYSLTVPATSDPNVTKWKAVIFVSLSQANNDWSNKINQTANLTYEAGKTLYDATSSPAWKPYESLILKTPTTLGISRSKVRFWLDRNEHYTTGYEYLLTVGGVYYSWSAVQLSATDTVNDFYFVYYDLPLSVLSGQNISFTIVDDRGYQVQTVQGLPYVAGTSTSAGDNSKIWRVNYSSGNFTLTKGPLDSGYVRFYRGLLAAAVEGYLSCDSNTDNGYGAFPAIDSNFILRNPDGTWKTMGYLSDRYINDFENVSDYETGNKTLSVNAQAKYDMLKKMYEDAHPSGLKPGTVDVNNNAKGIAIIGLVFALTTLGYVFSLKKKSLV